jgi:hypothetical protein
MPEDCCGPSRLATGSELAAYPLDAPPVFDGLIATSGRVLYSATDGRMVCFTES